MARKRRPSPTDEEIDRIAEAIHNLDVAGEIQDRDSFDDAYDDYFEEDLSMKKNENIKDKTFREIRKIDPDILNARLFKKAKGKDLKQDRKKTSKRLVRTKKQFIKRGSKRVDLEGYDTKRGFKPKRKRVFKIAGRVKKKVVYTSRETVTIKGKQFIRHRDKMGRFASIKKK